MRKGAFCLASLLVLAVLWPHPTHSRWCNPVLLNYLDLHLNDVTYLSYSRTTYCLDLTQACSRFYMGASQVDHVNTLPLTTALCSERSDCSYAQISRAANGDDEFSDDDYSFIISAENIIMSPSTMRVTDDVDFGSFQAPANEVAFLTDRSHHVSQLYSSSLDMRFVHLWTLPIGSTTEQFYETETVQLPSNTVPSAALMWFTTVGEVDESQTATFLEAIPILERACITDLNADSQATEPFPVAWALQGNCHAGDGVIGVESYEVNNLCVWTIESLGTIKITLEWVDTEAGSDFVRIVDASKSPYGAINDLTQKTEVNLGSPLFDYSFSGSSPANKVAEIITCSTTTIAFSSDGSFNGRGFSATISSTYQDCPLDIGEYYRGPTSISEGWRLPKARRAGILAAIICSSIVAVLIGLLVGRFWWRRSQEDRFLRSVHTKGNADVVEEAPRSVRVRGDGTNAVDRDVSGSRRESGSSASDRRASSTVNIGSGPRNNSLAGGSSNSVVGARPGTTTSVSGSGSRVGAGGGANVASPGPTLPLWAATAPYHMHTNLVYDATYAALYMAAQQQSPSVGSEDQSSHVASESEDAPSSVDGGSAEGDDVEAPPAYDEALDMD